MRELWTAFLAISMLLVAKAAASESCEQGNESMTVLRSDQTRVSLVLSRQKLAETPGWNAGVDSPPLSLSAAVDIASKWGNKRYSEFDEIAISAISLKSSPCRRLPQRWYFVFEFSTWKAGRPSSSSGNWLAVLMDGSIVEPAVN